MPSIDDLVEASYDQLFRLALLLTGDMRRAALHIQQAVRQAASAPGQPEQALLRAMLPRAARYGRWRPGPTQRQRAALPRPQADALLRLLAELPPATRLAVGLHYLRGLAPDELAAIAGEGAEAALASFRATAALRLGIAPADTPPPDLVQMDAWLRGRLGADEATALRGQIFADEETRAQRDAMQRVAELLPIAIAGLFAIDPPAAPQPAPAAPRPQRPRRAKALAALVAGVLLASALIMVVPGLFSPPAAPALALSAADVLDAAIHRFDQGQRGSGTLHERYRAAMPNGDDITIERWYDFASPNRLSVDVHSTRRAMFALRADGTGNIQYYGSPRWARFAPDQARNLVYQMPPAEAQAAMPVLRSALVADSPHISERSIKPDIGALYLAQARTQGAGLLGNTQMLGRDALLLRYTTTMLPGEQADGEQRQVLLAIDRELHALLDVTVLTERGGESASQRPWYAEQIELVENAPVGQFSIANTMDAIQITGVRSLSLPNIPSELFTTLEEAQRSSTSALLVPTALPEPMRGLLIDRNTSGLRPAYTLLYEGEFRTITLSQGGDVLQYGQLDPAEHSAGAYRYSLGSTPGSSIAVVSSIAGQGQPISIQFDDIYSTPEERAAALENIITSLTPVTRDNVQALQQTLVPMAVAGGAP
ncbi:hypothetical protein F8S13_16875 [Chloroflexia bacterium SDU3-3]|nr:hypothetical protein F8S13_16875 [Chloroflexia bacterium SDU3-3]